MNCFSVFIHIRLFLIFELLNEVRFNLTKGKFGTSLLSLVFLTLYKLNENESINIIII